MAITTQKSNLSPILEDNKKNKNLRMVKFICPICKAEKEFKIPAMIITNSPQLTTISVPRKAICEHHFHRK